MKNYLYSLLFISFQALSFEWEAGVREIYVTPESYGYNSESMARILRDLNDRGYERFSIHPRLEYAGDSLSLIVQPKYKSSMLQIGHLNTRVSLLDSKLTIKPIIFQKKDLGEARPLEGIRPSKPDVFISSYEQQMAQFARVSREKDVAKLVVGSGLTSLLDNPSSAKRIEAMFMKLRKTISPKTELVFEVVGDRELNHFVKAIQNGFKPFNLIDGVSIVLDPNRHYENAILISSEVEKTLNTLESVLPGKPVHLSRVVVPSCKTLKVEGGEFYCLDDSRNNELQQSRFIDLRNKIDKLLGKGFLIKSLEVMESHTDFEPEEVDPRYPYFNNMLNSKEFLLFPQKKTPLGSTFPLRDNHGNRLACIYYDKLDAPPMVDRMGEIHSIMLESNLGAFKKWKVTRKPLDRYISGEMSRCDSVFYLATNFMQQPSMYFLNELAQISSSTPVVWFNYKFNLLVEALKSFNQHPGFEVPVILQPDSAPSPTNTDPGFFRFFDYKGETFFKLAEWNQVSNNFAASAEINFIDITNKDQVDILSTARHSRKKETIPYVVRSENIWYFADSPLSFTHYEDRYFILADLLWDIMDEEAPKERIALARFEDIAPNTDIDALRWAIDYMHSMDAPFSLAVIPYYLDSVGDIEGNVVNEPITKYPRLVQAIRYATNRGGSIIMHGVAHALGDIISGYDGHTGSDYEFWLYPQNTPVPYDSVDWLTKRLDRGIEVFRKMGIKPAAFEAPHYAASVMNYLIFAKMFRWNYHRTVYFPFTIQKDTGIPHSLEAFACDPSKCGEKRRSILNHIEVDADYQSFGGVPVPYIIYRDPYGQRIIPETLGMVDFAFNSPKTWRPISTPDDIVRRAKKLKVIRGAIPSFFWHPHVFNRRARYYQEVPGSYETIGGKNSLRIIIEGIQALGYTFKSIEDKQYFPDEVF